MLGRGRVMAIADALQPIIVEELRRHVRRLLAAVQRLS
jgi:hypothetical protein